MSESNPAKPSSSSNDADMVAGGGRAVGAGQGWAWIAGAFDMFKSRPGTWILVMIVLFLLVIVLAFIPFLGSLAISVLFPVFVGGIMLGCHSLRQGGTLEVGHVFAGFKNRAGDLVVLGAISLAAGIVIMIPVMLIVGASVFFGAMQGDPQAMANLGMNVLLAGLVGFALSIPVVMALWFAPALVVLREMPPIEALKQSFRGCLRNIIPFLLYGIVMLVLSILAAIPLGLGFLILGPVLIASVYVAYRDIYGQA